MSNKLAAVDGNERASFRPGLWMPAEAPLKTVVFGDRRLQTRTRLEDVQGLLFLAEQPGSELAAVSAELIDVSSNGIGVEMAIPLRIGAEFSLVCEFYSEGYYFELKGTAKVTHCSSRRNGLFRVGMIYECVGCEMTYRACAPGRMDDTIHDPSKAVPINKLFALRQAG